MSAVRSFVIVSLLLLFGSCLQVESTEVRVVADPKNDRLDVMVVSRGVSSSGNEKDLQKDLADLRSCRDGACVIAPGLGVMNFAQAEDKADEAKAEARRQFVSFLDFEPGAFFVDGAGRLCFYQFVRIHRLAEFEAFCNERARATLLEDRKQISPETVALLEKAQQEGAKLVTIDGAGFRVRRPRSAADHRTERDKMWRDIVSEIVKAAGRQPADQAKEVVERMLERGLAQALRDNDIAIVRHHDATEYFVGTQGSEVCDYRTRGADYNDNLLVALTAEEPRPPVVTQELVEKQFTAFRTREARLPTVYAEIKRRSTPPKAR